MPRSTHARQRPWPLGVQLYTLRHKLERDFEGTLDRLAAAGYAEVESAGYFDRSAHVVRSSLRRAGLQAPSGHFPLESLERWNETLDFAATAGHSYIVILWRTLQALRSIGCWTSGAAGACALQSARSSG